jgi:rhodanese-related sulfurtransferase
MKGTAMRWKQFFTPVKSIDADQARDIITGKSPADLTILDVRQPGEYESGHIPGAKLIPLPDLGARIGEIEEAKPTIVY